MRALFLKTPSNVWLLFIVTNYLFAGCGSSDQSGPPMGEVSGTITYQGKPVVRASVVFLPMEKDVRAAVATTDESGYYRLNTSGELSGAYVGSYQVSIVARAPYDGPLPEGMSLAYAKEMMQNEGKPLIPEKYFAPSTSGLTAEVKSGRNLHDFSLED